jgi:hypothetical protein
MFEKVKNFLQNEFRKGSKKKKVTVIEVSTFREPDNFPQAQESRGEMILNP